MTCGACNCGAVKFELDEVPTSVFVCHCSICRKYTGSAGIAVIIVDNKRFRWTHGREHVTTWSKPGADWQSHFCCKCGTALPGPNDAERMYVPAGLIADGEKPLQVAHHIWVGSKASWDLIGDAGKQHQNGFGD